MAALILTSYLVAAMLYTALALHQLRRWHGHARHRPLVTAFVVVAVWSLFLGLLTPYAMLTQLAESARNLAFLAFMYGIMREAEAEEGQRPVRAVYAAVAATVGVQIAVGGVMAQFYALPLAFEALLSASQLLGLIVAAGALILVHNLYGQAAAESRATLRLPMIALAAMWAFDLHLYTLAYFTAGSDLGALRGLVFVLLAPLFALGVRGGPSWKIQLSRAATFQSVSLIAILFYLVAMMTLARLATAFGGEWDRMSEVGLIALMSAAALLILPSGKARAWLRVFLAKHVFEHRYDYRREWRRFTDTVGRERADGAALEERIIKGLADIAEAPAGVLLLVDAHYGLTPAARWNSALDLPLCGEGAEGLLRFVEQQSHVLDFTGLRGGVLHHGEESATVPAWLAGLDTAWAGVPLIHSGRLIALVILDQPSFRRPLDWEDLDLFRTVGIQAASYLAEAKSQQALADARRFDEFNRRFAFILHDIKNLVSQLSLVTRNAERHADNPEFRADMIATLQSSVRKMNDLLLRLSPEAARPSEPLRAVPLGPLIEGVATAKRRGHPVLVEGDGTLAALVDPAGLEQAITHLVQNAIDASPAETPVRLTYFESGGDVAIEIADQGAGMSSEFIATRLFQPFASTKATGFGIGAYEARALIQAMGGRLEVESAEGHGSCFTLFLPGAEKDAAPIIERMRA